MGFLNTTPPPRCLTTHRIHPSNPKLGGEGYAESYPQLSYAQPSNGFKLKLSASASELRVRSSKRGPYGYGTVLDRWPGAPHTSEANTIVIVLPFTVRVLYSSTYLVPGCVNSQKPLSNLFYAQYSSDLEGWPFSQDMLRTTRV